MNEQTSKLIETFKEEYRRTKGKEPVVRYHAGWFIINGQKGIGPHRLAGRIAEMKTYPTVSDRIEYVNGIATLIMAHQHVVQNLLSGKDVVEARDTPPCCSVASETYWSM